MRKIIFTVAFVIAAIWTAWACVVRIATVMATPINEQPDTTPVIALFIGFMAMGAIAFIEWLLKDEER